MSADLERKVFEKTISSVERRVSRRSFVVRAASLGSLIAVAPVRFLTRQSQAGCVRPGDCSGNNCGPDGYSAFCCTINGKNSCPSGTFIGGYWACTNFKGKGLCNKKPNEPDVRWYLDCHAKPGKEMCGLRMPLRQEQMRKAKDLLHEVSVRTMQPGHRLSRPGRSEPRLHEQEGHQVPDRPVPSPPQDLAEPVQRRTRTARQQHLYSQPRLQQPLSQGSAREWNYL
jgi:hypothetical protein